MLRSIYLVLIYVLFLVLGASAPFVIGLGYVWVETFTPQNVAYLFLPGMPISLIMGASTVLAYFILDRKSPPPIGMSFVLSVTLAIWVTITTFMWAVAPDAASSKWNYAVKTILFYAFVPFVFRTRIQIEALLQVYLFSAAAQFLPVGLKTLLSGGGYGMNLGITEGNSGLSEGSTLAAVCLMLVPIALYLRQYSKIIPKTPLTDLGYLGIVVVAIAAAIGTYERTALIGLIVVGCGLWLRARRKILSVMIGTVAAAALAIFASDSWHARIATTTQYEHDSSALGRVLVWKWTLNFVSSHPLGGGFNSYVIDRIVFPGTLEHPAGIVEMGKAFHSIYFEMLGEQGWPGLVLFVALIATSLVNMQFVARRCRGEPGMAWCRDLAYTVQISLVTLLACGAFIGIAFQAMLYLLFAISACVKGYISQIDSIQPSVPTRTWRGYAAAQP